ncbi:uncharacterized protein LOC142343952 [Convolutriloba macropyga]|uniref:uncharacterized protein LOC142343952 n=1 Tax=Convolutriloba macropyga TaxID=536237 RepID=UPI003F521D27
MLEHIFVLACVAVVAQSGLPPELWLPNSEFLYETSQKCIDIYEGRHNYSSITKLDDYSYYVIPEEHEPGQKEGLSEQNMFARYILCMLNQKRAQGNLNRVRWHYGLAYQAGDMYPCDTNRYPQYSRYGYNVVRLQSRIITSQQAYLDDDLLFYDGVGLDVINKWYEPLRSYEYPINKTTEEPLPFYLCASRDSDYAYFEPDFVAMMWHSVTRVGCAPVHCSGNAMYMNCLFGAIKDVSPKPFTAIFPNYNGEVFSLFARSKINEATLFTRFGGLPTCKL